MVDGWWDADKNKIRWSADFRIDVPLFGVCLSVYRGERERGRRGEGKRIVLVLVLELVY